VISCFGGIEQEIAMLVTILMILALICFLIAATGHAWPPLQTGWLGLAFWVLAQLIGASIK